MSTEKSGEKKKLFTHTAIKNVYRERVAEKNVKKKSNPGVQVAQTANPQFG